MKRQMLRTYFGVRRDHLPGSTVRWYGVDNADNYQAYLENCDYTRLPEQYRVDGEWCYTFNQLGYRGEDYDPDADFRVFAVGASNAFGTGVKWEQSWPLLLTKSVSDVLGKKRPNCLNFAQGGASNDYTCRTAVRQCVEVRPDLLVVWWTYAVRIERAVAGFVRHFSPDNAHLHQSLLEWYTDEEAVVRTLKNMLLVQWFCGVYRIPYIFGWTEYRKLRDPRFLAHPVCAELFELLDTSKFCDFSIEDQGIRLDRGRDGMHPGAQTHRIFADRLLDRWKSCYGVNGS